MRARIAPTLPAIGRPLFYTSRCSGMMVRSTIDCLIASVVIEYELGLLHNNSDFADTVKVITEITLA